jgi:hypothetical protein
VPGLRPSAIERGVSASGLLAWAPAEAEQNREQEADEGGQRERDRVAAHSIPSRRLWSHVPHPTNGGGWPGLVSGFPDLTSPPPAMCPRSHVMDGHPPRITCGGVVRWRGGRANYGRKRGFRIPLLRMLRSRWVVSASALTRAGGEGRGRGVGPAALPLPGESR